ncbi:MAG TPA: ECF-type sigma factor [Bryobacteraceae bacterium]|nr:ECF-type sigma factor [Bryobacteraceae bacterium]
MMELTLRLKRLHSGDNSALNDLIPLVYDELKKLARSHLRREGRSASLETTSLVHEAFLKLANGRHPQYENRSHFYGIASRLMRQILVDMARARQAKKRGIATEIAVANLPDFGDQTEAPVLALDDALNHLGRTDMLKAKLVEMRFFAGLTAEECSECLSVPVHKVRRELRLAQAWLRREMASATAA